jgi:hypothetical protein
MDHRPGCNCPYSACDKKCLSVCRASEYRLGPAVPGISVAGRQEALLGASSSGDTILYLAGEGCAIDRLMLARRRGSTFESVDLTDKLDLRRVAIFEGCCTLSADGETLVMATADRMGFVRSRLVGVDMLPADGAEFGGLVPSSLAGRAVRYPVLAADGLTLYFHVQDPGTEPGEPGPLHGAYVAVRGDRQSAFGAGRRMTGRAQRYDYVTGISSDGLSLFVKYDWETYVLFRANPAEPFSDPAMTRDPAWTWRAARLPGWRTLPLGDCQRILTTYTPGGCQNEDITYLEAAPQ